MECVTKRSVRRNIHRSNKTTTEEKEEEEDEVCEPVFTG